MKVTCETLKTIRKQIADANGIPYEPHVCTYSGPCMGTCPACEAEARYIEVELAKRRLSKQPVNIIGVAKDWLPSPSSFSQAVAAATITAAMTFTALPFDAAAQHDDASKIVKTNRIRVNGVVRNESSVLPGVSIGIKGTGNYLKSDKDGNFSIDASVGDTLVVKCLGYEDKEVLLTHTDKLTVTLERMSGERIRLAGGVPTLINETQPLYVVDGVPVNCGIDKSGLSNPLGKVNPKHVEDMKVLKDSSEVAPYSDCENAKYGVILVTTKNGHRGPK
ncbi:MAG: carboxypeptidase-like regulatory domain-containing protein [Paludibacteraceae bacterium]|nr:carboxypeptidase-like regulatory domain-containing protein [Paludibacteraceae bacterium]